ncbi:MAG: glycosyl hydrolase [Paenibacillaceae bacterium]|jgi:unsaturated rhamnogalacturonyl hydrolase|nr:glycosyl hydrolase [Paenibacillaceae bacterium]
MEMIEDSRIVLGKAQQVYDHMTTAPPDDGQRTMDAWDWKPGVGLMAVWSYYQATGRAEAREYVKSWIQDHKHKAAQLRTINSTAPFTVLAELLRHMPEADEALEWGRLAHEHGQWLMQEAPRTSLGGFEHTVTEGVLFQQQLWADTLVVGTLFLARMASLRGDAEMARESVRQVVVHLRLLQDPETGVLFHGYDCLHGNHMSAALWGRANAWVTFGVPEIVGEVRHLTDIPDEIGERYERLVKGLLRFQTTNGMWHTVVNRPDFYLETSASAGIAYGFLTALRVGIIPEGDLRKRMKEAVRKSLHAVMILVDVYGAVHGVSGGTPVLPSIEAYNAVKITPTPYGQALTLMLLSEVLRNPAAISGSASAKEVQL